MVVVTYPDLRYKTEKEAIGSFRLAIGSTLVAIDLIGHLRRSFMLLVSSC